VVYRIFTPDDAEKAVNLLFDKEGLNIAIIVTLGEKVLFGALKEHVKYHMYHVKKLKL
jgi:hypothetical protein